MNFKTESARATIHGALPFGILPHQNQSARDAFHRIA
jgi:hypothetical protein